MATSRARVALMVGVLGLVALLGVVWLFTTARSRHSTQGAGNAGLQSGPVGSPGAMGSPGAVASSGGQQSGGSQLGGDSAPPPAGPTHRVRSIRVSGVRLDGADNGGGCVTIINKTSVPAVFSNISVTAPADAGAGVVVDSAECQQRQGDPVCAGAEVRPGSNCVVGARLTGNPRPGDYTLTVQVGYRYLCTSKADDPCNYPELADVPMSAADPVEVTGTSSSADSTTRVPAMTISVTGASISPSASAS
jgi:hypothetical protein